MTPSSVKSVGIIGQGSFGTFLQDIIPKDLLIHTLDSISSAEDLNEVASCDVVILAVPLSAYPEILKQIADILPSDSLIIDVCSVKEKATQYLDNFLPKHKNRLLTHPLFGPQTYSKEGGFSLIVTESHSHLATSVLEYCKDVLGLNIIYMSAAEHDKQMAYVHGLTFFLARGLGKLDLQDLTIATPSFKHLQNLIYLDRSHSEDLFETIELGNRYAKRVRERFLRDLEQIEEELHSKSLDEG